MAFTQRITGPPSLPRQNPEWLHSFSRGWSLVPYGSPSNICCPWWTSLAALSSELSCVASGIFSDVCAHYWWSSQISGPMQGQAAQDGFLLFSVHPPARSVPERDPPLGYQWISQQKFYSPRESGMKYFSCLRGIDHSLTGLRILWNILYNFRWGIWLNFFRVTGFHRLHVIIGSVSLLCAS